MKKIFTLTLVLAMMLTLFAGCTSSGSDVTTGATEETTEETTEVTTEATEETTEEATDDTTGETDVETPELSATEQLLNDIVAINPVEFMGMTMALDLTDTSEDGLWNLNRYTGLDNADAITEAAFFEPMMGSIAYSMVAVRVAEGQDAKAVAESMKNGINPAKWVCVEADDLLVAGCGDTVLLIMVSSETGLTAQSFVDAFQTVCGADLDFTI